MFFKKVCASVVLVSTLVSSQIVQANNPVFSTQEIAKVQIPDITFKYVMRALYPRQLVNTYVRPDELGDESYIGVGKPEKDGYSTVAIMHGPVSYLNQNQDLRYLVVVEKVKVNSEGYLFGCHVCGAKADIYTFKEIEGGYQLLSRNLSSDIMSAKWGRIDFDLDQIDSNIQKFGKNLIGSYYQVSDTNHGEDSSNWYVLHLPEDGYIKNFKLAEAAYDNSGKYGEDSPLSTSFESTVTINESENTYFPVDVLYSGEKEDFNTDKIINMNGVRTFKFDEKTRKYQRFN